jgi:hypothetical protein
MVLHTWYLVRVARDDQNQIHLHLYMKQKENATRTMHASLDTRLSKKLCAAKVPSERLAG